MVINPKNEEDKECFKWTILVALHHKILIRSQNEYRNSGGLRVITIGEDWNFPSHLVRLASLNRAAIGGGNILAIGGGKEKLYILRKAEFNNQRKTANLLPIVEDENRHYVAIKNLSQLLASSNSERQHKHYFCVNCIQGFQSENTKDKHFNIA